MTHTYLQDIDFSAPASDISCGGHIAYTFESQGGAASGYNTPLMFKGNEQPSLSFEKIEKLASLGEDVTQLRKDYISQLMSSLQYSANEKYGDNGWSWISVVDADFDNNIVVFVVDDGLYMTTFTLEGLVATVADTASPAMSVTQYEIVNGDILISIDFFDNIIDDAISGLTKNAIKHQHVKDLLVKAKNGAPDKGSVNAENTDLADPSANTSDINKGENPLDNINKEEFLKSTEFQDLLKAMAEEAVQKAREEARAEAEAEALVEIERARAEAEELRIAEKARVEEDYATVIKSFDLVEEDKVETLVKYLIENVEVAETIVKAFDKAKNEVETIKNEFGKEKGTSVSNNAPVVKSSSDLIAKRAQEMKARKTK